MKRRYLAYAPHAFASGSAKTAHGVMRYSDDDVIAVIDPDHVGKTAGEVVAFLDGDTTPIFSRLEDGLALGATALLLGTAPQGGALPPSWRNDILCAMRAGLDIVSGLHDFLRDDPEFFATANACKVQLWDVRAVPTSGIFSGAVYDVPQPILLAVGNDCAVGKMSACLELTRVAQRIGTQAVFVPTGQTGIMIAGWGVAIDRVIADFATGAAEGLVVHASQQAGAQILIVEGQGCINHPAYAPVTLALLYGCAPDALLLVCEAQGSSIEPFETPRLNYAQLIAEYERTLAMVKPASVIGIALNTRGLNLAQAKATIADAKQQTGLPCDDLVRFDAAAFYQEIAPTLCKRSRRNAL